MTDLLKKAIDFYYNCGFECFPLSITMENGKKKPSPEPWKEFISHEQSIMRLRPEHNAIAIKTGRQSDLWVLDVDKKENVDGFDTMKELEIDVPENVPCQLTQSGGYHFFFKFPDIDKKYTGTTNKPSKGLDCRGDGGVIYAAPTKINGGGEYQFLKKIGDSEMIVPSQKIVDWYLSTQSDINDEKIKPIFNLKPSDLTDAQYEWFVDCLSKCNSEKGSRSEYDFGLCCMALKVGLDKYTVYQECKNIGKFKTDGQKYFEHTWANAEKEVPYNERAEFKIRKQKPIQKKVNSITEKQKSDPIKIVRVTDFENDIKNLFVNGYNRGDTTGWHELDKYYRVVKGQLTTITGIPSHGKSEFIDALLINLAVILDWRFVVFSPENYPFSVHFQKLAEKYCNKPMFGSSENKMNDVDIKKSIDFINRHFYFVDAMERNAEIGSILDATSMIMKQTRIDGLLIDPWNELENSRPKNMTETEYIGYTLMTFRKFLRKNVIAGWIVAHPAKLKKNQNDEYPVPSLYDISGSAHWYNKSDNGIVIWRNFEENYTKIFVKKIKFKYHGSTGEIKLVYNRQSGRYEELQQDLDPWQDGKS